MPCHGFCCAIVPFSIPLDVENTLDSIQSPAMDGPGFFTSFSFWFVLKGTAKFRQSTLASAEDQNENERNIFYRSVQSCTYLLAGCAQSDVLSQDCTFSLVRLQSGVQEQGRNVVVLHLLYKRHVASSDRMPDLSL